MKMHIFENIKLRYGILAIFSSLLCLVVVSEIFYSSKAHKELVLRFEKDHYSKKISQMAANWLNSYFKQIELVVSILSRNSVIDEVGNLNFNDFEELFKKGLTETPFTTGFYVTFKDGSMLQIMKLNHLDGKMFYRTEREKSLPSYASYALRRLFGDDQGREHWEYLNSDLSLISKEIEEDTTYDPRKRGWYTQAAQSSIQFQDNIHITWSDAYVFNSTRRPGITVSRPIVTKNEAEIDGVLSVDFDLEEFKKLLVNIKPTEKSSVRLINNKNEVLASTFGDDTFKIEKNETVVLPKITETQDEILKKAAEKLLATDETISAYKIKNGKEYLASMQKLNDVPFSILMITPQSDFISSFEAVQKSMFLISIFVFLASSLAVIWLSRRISDPIAKLCKSAMAIGNMDLENYPMPPNSDILEIQELSKAVDSMKLSISTFSKYAPKDLVRKLLSTETKAEIGGKTKEITLFFSHIDKFALVSERLPAEYLIFHLSEYFDELTKIIMENQGTIDKYMGDSIMALWGAPNPDEDQVMHACEAALNCQEILKKLEKKWDPLGKPSLPTRIGLHTGQAIVGNIGSEDRMNFTAIGDSVNIASRLEGANKVYGTKILASEFVEEKARSKILFRVIDRIAVKGKNFGITIYEPICSIKNADDKYYKLMELCSKSKEAFELFQARKFKDALRLYLELAESFPERIQSITPTIERCKQFIKTPPSRDWDGINYLTKK